MKKSIYVNKYAHTMADAPTAPWDRQRIQTAVSGGLIFFLTFFAIFFGWTTLLMVPLIIGALELFCAVFGVCVIDIIMRALGKK